MKRSNRLVLKRAELLIPGGAHTYSKGRDQFPDNAQIVVDRGLGCYLWDVEGTQYLDYAMSLGSVILGHAYEPVLESVRAELVKGVNFCRPSIIESELAELLIDTIPSAEMVKFGKNGSDAVTAAVKLARAYTGKNFIARCEQDAFNSIHDWFIGSTVLTRGVPKQVRELTLKFSYNDIESCKELFNRFPGDIACFILEPLSLLEPKNNFLIELKDLCEKNGCLLIFDEVVSGFRFALGGAQEIVSVTPHLSAFGKAMANGFSVSALVGQKDIMKLGGIDHDEERMFLLSTTHGGETHSIAAAIKCIQEIKRTNAIKHFWSIGEHFKSVIKSAAESVGAVNHLNISGFDVRPIISFNDFEGDMSFPAKTLFMQELAKEKILAPYVTPCLAHSKEMIDSSFQAFQRAFEAVKNAGDNQGILKAINGNQIKAVFRKFN